MASYTIYLVAVLLTINAAYAIKCYNCNNQDSPTCGYSFLSFSYPSTECEAKSGSGILDAISNFIPKSCVKVVGKDNEGNQYVARSCGLKGACQAEAKLVGLVAQNVVDFTCYTCDTDNCNSATRFTGLALVGLIAACFAFLF